MPNLSFMKNTPSGFSSSRPRRYRRRKKKSRSDLPKIEYYNFEETLCLYEEGETFTVYDLEHTGSRQQEIIEIGAVKFSKALSSKKSVPEFQKMIKTDPDKVPWQVRKKIGISAKEMIAGGNKQLILEEFMEFIEGTIQVCHSAADDFRTMNMNLKQLKIPVLKHKMVCTQRFARDNFRIIGLKLENLVEHFDVPLVKAHRAFYDALATRDIFKKILKTPLPPPLAEKESDINNNEREK
jgi:DNA polymerase III epsilon subunit-like protein